MSEKLTFERYEFKYFVRERVVDAVRRFAAPFLEPDEYAAKHPGGRYRIHNLYWDTPELHFYRAHCAGSDDRFKLRIRSYGDGQGARFLEVKRKIKQVIIKHRAKLDAGMYEGALAGDWEQAIGRDSGPFLQEFLARAVSHGAVPTIAIRYEREAYKSVFADDARLTFDRGLCYQIVDQHGSDREESGWIYVEETPDLRSPVLIELKATGYFPGWMSDLVQRFDLQRINFSKYLVTLGHHLELRKADFDRLPRSVLGRGGSR